MSRERRTRRQASNALGVVVLVVSLLIFGGMFLASRLGGSRQGPDLCDQSGPSGLLALAVDATDRLSEAQILDVKNRLQREVADVPSNWRVEVWNVAPASGLPVTVGSPLCKPERDVSSLTANPRIAQQRYQQFSTAIDRTLDELLSRPASTGSPILESLQAVGLRSFGAPSLPRATARRLVLVSDLVQNTSRLSFLRGLPPYEAFRNGNDFNMLRAPISETHVDVLFLARPGGPPPSALIAWWQQYFLDMGARLASVQRIVG
jgi:hypothetical protein